jgi:hypothetical protein
MASHQEGKTGDGCDRGTKRASVRAARPSAVRSRRRRVTRRPGGRAIQNKALPAPAEVRRAVARALQQPASYPASGAMAERAYQARPVEGVRPVRLLPVTLTSRLVGVPRPLQLYEAEPPRRCGSGIPLIRDDLLPLIGKQVVDGAPVGIPIHRKWATAAEDSLCRQTATVTR